MYEYALEQEWQKYNKKKIVYDSPEKSPRPYRNTAYMFDRYRNTINDTDMLIK